MDDQQQEAYANELMQERYRENVEALRRCIKAGARKEDVNRLAFECGVDPKFITIEREEQHGQRQ